MDQFVARDKIEHCGKWYIVSTINRESSSPFAQGLTYAETMAFECDPDRGDKLLRIVAQDEAPTGSTHAHKRMVARIRQYGDSEPVDEAPESWAEPEMCPNCVTPWKCNGPHEFPQAASSEAAVAFDAERFERAPCYLCGYNGRGYYQPETHPCAAKYHAHPAPTTADAGVTEAMVETFEAKFLECARTRPDSTLRDDIRAALVAALARAGGK